MAVDSSSALASCATTTVLANARGAERSGPRAAGALACSCLFGLVVSACSAAPPAQGSVGQFANLVSDSGAAPVQGTAIAGPAVALPDDPLGVDPDTAAVLLAQGADQLEPEPPENPYIRFGERIVVHHSLDGRETITKPFPMPPGKAQRIIELIRALDPFPLRQRPGPADVPPPDSAEPEGAVDYLILENWDQEYYTDLAAVVPGPAIPVNVSDVLVITAEAEPLAEFEAFLDLFSAGVPQIELEAKVIEIVDTDSLDVGVDATFDFGTDTFIKSLGFNLPNTADAAEALLTLGAVQDGFAFDALIELVQTWQNVTIETRPKTVVRAGGLARLESTVEIPYVDVKTLSDTGAFTTGISYKSTGVKLYITPRVVGSTALALDVQLENSQAVSFQPVLETTGTSGGEQLNEISVPVIAYRTARTVVYLEPGQTLLIGGLTQETSQENVRKVPILGDLPILGFFFRSTFTEKRREHVIFAISPRIIQRGDLRAVL